MKGPSCATARLAPEREASILQVFLRASGYSVNPDGRS
jgi:hypothetical protein